MKKASIIILTLLVVLAFASCKNTENKSEGFGNDLDIEYIEKDSLNFSLDLPFDWTESSSSYLGTEVRHYNSKLDGPTDDIAESISVTMEKPENYTSVDEYAKANIENLKITFADFKIISDLQTEKIGDFEGLGATFSYTMGVYKIVIEQSFVMTDDGMYIITCTATDKSYDGFKDVFKSAKESFKVI